MGGTTRVGSDGWWSIHVREGHRVESRAQELEGSLQQCGWRQETMADPRETRERRMREEVTPQDNPLPLPFFSFSPASKAGERSWAWASSRLWATRPTSCLSSQTRESLSSALRA